MRRRSKVVWFSPDVCLSKASCLSDLSRLSYNYHEHMHIYDAFGRGVCVCLSVCLHDNWKTIAGISSVLGSYIDRTKI